MRVPLHFDDAVQVTCSDTVQDPNMPQPHFAGFVASGTGTVALVTPGGNTVSVNVVAGGIYGIPFTRIKVTGTTTTAGITGCIQFL